MKVNKNCKCRYCHWYRPKKNQRCWGFNEEDIKKCIEDDYMQFTGRHIIVKKVKS